MVPIKNIAWNQAPHWGLGDGGEKNMASETSREVYSEEGKGFARRYFSYLTPFFSFFSHCEAWSHAIKDIEDGNVDEDDYLPKRLGTSPGSNKIALWDFPFLFPWQNGFE